MAACDLTTQDIIELKAPQLLDGLDQSVIDKHICLAELQTGKDAFGDKYELAVALKVMHDLQMEEDAKENGGINQAMLSGKKEQGLSLTFKDGTGKNSSEENLQGTTWGQQLLALRNECILSITNICG